MSHHTGQPLVPRDGHELVVCAVARISGCTNQKEVSLDDQIDHVKEAVAKLYVGPEKYRIISTKGKGERLDRPELAKVEAMIRTGELDLMVFEDIGRLVRGMGSLRLIEIAVDRRTRVISLNDFVDTSRDSWKQDVINACSAHASHNEHTSRRIKQKLMNRFLKFGGSTPLPIFGYVKPEDVKTYDEWRKDPAAEPIYVEWARRLLESPNCAAVADWLNCLGVPTGPYCRRKTWDGPTVRRVTGNTVLKGMPGRGFKHTDMVHEFGRRTSVKNPQGPKFLAHPHLAFWDSGLFDEINARLDAAGKGRGRKPVKGSDPRSGVPRKRTRFPGQHAVCMYCGRQCVWGGNGMAENLQCNGSREWRCWNSIGFSGALAVDRVVAAIGDELSRLEGFDEQFRELVEEARREGGGDQERERAELEKAEREDGRHRENLAAGIAEYGPMPELKEKLSGLEARARDRAARRRELDRIKGRVLELPASAAELRRLMEEKFRGLARDSPEFGDLLRRVVPEFHVHLVRLCDGGHLLPRARITLDLGGVFPDAARVPGVVEILRRELTIDLFEPPQRERIREEVMRLAAGGLEQREIAARIAEGPTQTAVCNALALDRMIRERGLETPYEFLTGPPPDYGKLRRHKNPKYRFEPAEGYLPPS